MARGAGPPRKKPSSASASTSTWKKLSLESLPRFWEEGRRLAVKWCTDPNTILPMALAVLLAEVIINPVIIERVPYTEIDWKAYMSECEGFLNGSLDYSTLKGDTGPLVYPAGFVYVYSALYYLTGRGENILIGQYVFLAIYMMQLVCVFRLHSKTGKVPPYALAISALTSYRIHSIYVLRLFNDPIAVLLLYVSLNLYLSSRWTLGSVFYSLAVSVKMNILLYSPALLLFFLTNMTIGFALCQLFVCAAVQLVLGLPFLYGNPLAYLKGSFDLGRVFEHKWTVNYRFLDTAIFEDRRFHIALLVIHVSLLMLFFPMAKRYLSTYLKLKYVNSRIRPQLESKVRENKAKKSKSKNKRPDDAVEPREELSKDQEDFLKSFETSLKSQSPRSAQKKKTEPSDEIPHVNFNKINQLFVTPMFLANFIGIVCARSLHYQFYSWYFHSLPYLLWSTNFSIVIKFFILALIEFSWNTYPSTVFSSALLHVCHLKILWGVYRNYQLAK